MVLIRRFEMRKSIILLIISGFILGFLAAPSFALSDNAEKFLLSCRALDSKFPPENWDKSDLRNAALEVLDAIESGSYDRWPLDFCIKTLGYTQFPGDLDRILAYEDEMTYSVLRSLSGFPHERAINTLIKYLDDEEAPKRESAIIGLQAMDFRKLTKGSEFKNRILTELIKARQDEKENWLVKQFNEAIAKVQSAPVTAKKNK
jgi:hypothetical protein